jgi:hypothetical protein
MVLTIRHKKILIQKYFDGSLRVKYEEKNQVHNYDITDSYKTHDFRKQNINFKRYFDIRVIRNII